MKIGILRPSRPWVRLIVSLGGIIPEKQKPAANVNFVCAKNPEKERILCLDEKTGGILWKDRYQADYSLVYPHAIGPRTTPLVDDGMVYTLGAAGHLHEFSAAKGEIVWNVNLIEDYQFETPLWGTSAHPLVDDDLLICTVGGEGSTVVAFDKKTGAEKWTALNAHEPGYETPVIESINGHRQLLVWDAENVDSLNPRTGEVSWIVSYKPDYGMHHRCAPGVEGSCLRHGVQRQISGHPGGTGWQVRQVGLGGEICAKEWPE